MKIIDNIEYYVAVGLPEVSLAIMLAFLYVGIFPVNLIPILVLVVIGWLLVLIGSVTLSCNNEEIIIAGDAACLAAWGLYIACMWSDKLVGVPP